MRKGGLDISEKRSTKDADAGIVCPDFAIFREFHLKKCCPRMNLSGVEYFSR